MQRISIREAQAIPEFCYYDRQINKNTRSAECKLWVAVILQAIKDYRAEPMQYRTPSLQRQALLAKDSAAYWLFNNNTDNPFSLSWVCDHIRISKETIQKTAVDHTKCIPLPDDLLDD